MDLTFDHLQQYVSLDQIPTVLEGTYPYHHESWVRFRKVSRNINAVIYFNKVWSHGLSTWWLSHVGSVDKVDILLKILIYFLIFFVLWSMNIFINSFLKIQKPCLWNIFQKLEPFLLNCRLVACRLVDAMQLMSSSEKMPQSVTESAEMIQAHELAVKMAFEDEILLSLQSDGPAIISALRREEESFSHSEDYR